MATDISAKKILLVTTRFVLSLQNILELREYNFWSSSGRQFRGKLGLRRNFVWGRSHFAQSWNIELLCRANNCDLSIFLLNNFGDWQLMYFWANGSYKTEIVQVLLLNYFKLNTINFRCFLRAAISTLQNFRHLISSEN